MFKLSLLFSFFLSTACSALPGAHQEDPEELRQRLEELGKEFDKVRQQLIRSRLEIFQLRLEKARGTKESGQELSIILKDGLGSEFPELHRQAFLELGKLSLEDRKRALEPVLEQWKIADEVFRVDALPFLNGVDHPDATAMIFIAAKDTSPDVRRAAAGVLKTTKGNRAFSILEELLQDPQFEVRGAAIEALGVPKNDEAVAPLLKLIGSENNPTLLEKTSYALGVIGSEKAVPGLLEVLSSSNENVQWAAISSLGKIGDPRATEYIRPLLSPDHSLYLRKIAITTLGRLKDGTSMEAFIRMVQDDPNEELRAITADAIGRLDDPTALDPVLECFKKEKSDSVRKAIWKTILRLSGTDFDRLEKVLLSILPQEKISPIEEIAQRIYAVDVNESKRLPSLMGKVAYRMFIAGEWRRALLHYKKLVTILPGHLEGHRRMAQCYLALGDTESAIRSLEASVSLAKAHPDLWWKLQQQIVMLFIQIGDPARIVEKTYDLLHGANGPIPEKMQTALDQSYQDGVKVLLEHMGVENKEEKRAAIQKVVRLDKKVLLPLAEALTKSPSPELIEAGNTITGTELPETTTQENLLEETANEWRAWYNGNP